MVCSRCKVKALKDRLLSQHPDGDIPPAESEPLIEACIVCSHGCMDAKGKPRCAVYRRKCQARKTIAALTEKIAELAPNAERRPDLYGFALSQKKSALAEQQKTLAAVLRECSFCDRSSDDNPQHNGVTFFSLDASPVEIPTDGTLSKSDGDFSSESCPQSASWLYRHALPQNSSNQSRATSLPPDIEDKWRIELANFTGESLVTKFLVCLLLSRKPSGAFYNLSDFANLRWLHTRDAAGHLHDTEFTRFLYAAGYRLVPTDEFLAAHRDDPDAHPHVSKQSVHFRFKTLVRKMPTIAAVSHGQIGRGSGGSPRRIAANASADGYAADSADTSASDADTPPISSPTLIQGDLFDYEP